MEQVPCGKWTTFSAAISDFPMLSHRVGKGCRTKPFVRLRRVKYPTPGAPELAKRVKQLLMESACFEQVDEDEQHGLDYGAWVPLMLMYPEADIPVCQLSVQPDKDATYHYKLGKVLSSLKDEGVLIFGSGAATHNFQDPESQNVDGSVTPWAAEFFDWLKQALLDGRYGYNDLKYTDWLELVTFLKI